MLGRSDVRAGRGIRALRAGRPRRAHRGVVDHGAGGGPPPVDGARRGPDLCDETASLVETGTHDDLFARDGVYADLVRRQTRLASATRGRSSRVVVGVVGRRRVRCKVVFKSQTHALKGGLLSSQDAPPRGPPVAAGPRRGEERQEAVAGRPAADRRAVPLVEERDVDAPAAVDAAVEDDARCSRRACARS